MGDDDTITLDNAVFNGLSLGALASGAFVRGASATQADDRIIYDPASGKLYFDADGAGRGAAVLVTTLDGVAPGGLTLQNDIFFR